MEETRIVVVLLVVMVGLIALAHRLKVPYPILLVGGGLVIGFVPGLPKIQLAPDTVFFLFLPPLILMAAYYMPTRDFKASLRSIGLLAVGLVLVTMVAVAIVAHTVIKGIPWSAAFVLGAVVAPPDTVAADAVTQNLRLPRRMLTVLEGESLLNDATALVAYRIAVAAVLSDSFSWFEAGGKFVFSSVGGVAFGLAVGFALTSILRHLVKDIPVYIISTLLSSYVTYLLADAAGVSSVLAVVGLGFFYAQPRFSSTTAELRLQTVPVWDIIVFVLNGFIFILIGLQWPFIVGSLTRLSALTLLGYALAICLTVIIVRILWVFLSTYLPRLPKKVRARDPFPPWQQVVVVSWTGMRGIVSLAAALALPLTGQNGQPFPYRNMIIFLTFSVILATLVLQGLTLPFLVRWLKVVDDDSAQHEENKARLRAAQVARDRLLRICTQEGASLQIVEKLRVQYEKRVERFTDRYEGKTSGETEQYFITYEHLEEELLQAEVAAVIQLRDDSVINDEALRRVQHDLDLELLLLRSVHGNHQNENKLLDTAKKIEVEPKKSSKNTLPHRLRQGILSGLHSRKDAPQAAGYSTRRD